MDIYKRLSVLMKWGDSFSQGISRNVSPSP